MAKTKIQGHCSGCSEPIPFGALVTTGRYKTVEWAPGFRVQKPDVIYCQKCKHLAEKPGYRPHRSHHHPSQDVRQPVKEHVEAQAVNPTRERVLQLATALYKAAGDHPGTAEQLADKVGVQYGKVIDVILKKLAEKNKLKKKNGVWMQTKKMDQAAAVAGGRR